MRAGTIHGGTRDGKRAPLPESSLPRAARYVRAMRALSAWFHSHPIFSIFAAFLAVGLCAHFFLNWRSERCWQAYAEAARARGVKLYLTDFAPPKIPDAENFAALPMMRAILPTGAKGPMALPGNDHPNLGNPLKGERLDWEKWQAFFKDAGFISETTDSPPRDVLRALEHYAPQFQEWSEWKTRPRCRFDLDLKAGAAIPFPYLNIFHDAVELFSLQTRAHLGLGESTAAYDSFRNALQTYRALADEPTLICGLVRIASLRVVISTVGEGLREHFWANAELEKIAADLNEVRIWNDYTSAFASERGYVNGTEEEYLAMSPWSRAQKISAITAVLGLSGPQIGFAFALLIPDRMIRDNQVRANHYFDELLDRVNADGTRYDPDGATPSDADHLRGFDEIWFALSKKSAPVFSFMGRRFAFVQTQVDLARLAIALERFRMARSAFPKTLAELVPDMIAALPDDIYTGKPLTYRRDDHDGFLLYSVGPNRRDDGGANDSKRTDANQPDWVWPHSPGR